MFLKTSTEMAPWYIIPADYKWVARSLIAEIISQKIQMLDLRFPHVSAEGLKELEKARNELNSE